MNLLKLALFSLLAITAVCGQTDSQRSEITATPSTGLTVEYIANEGILIKSGGKTILIDAIHRFYKPDYAFTPAEMLEKIENARFPYNNINLILVSHNHFDHFHPDSIAMHLMNNQGAFLVSSDQVIDAVLASGSAPGIKEKQLMRIKYEWKESVFAEYDGVKIRFLAMLHANSEKDQYRKIQNFGHLIEIDGKKLLHIGDADMFAENFGAFELEKEDLDIVFVPYWFLSSAEGRAILNKELKAKTVVAMHIPPDNRSATVRDLLQDMPSAVVFSEFGERLNY